MTYRFRPWEEAPPRTEADWAFIDAAQAQEDAERVQREAQDAFWAAHQRMWEVYQTTSWHEESERREEERRERASWCDKRGCGNRADVDEERTWRGHLPMCSAHRCQGKRTDGWQCRNWATDDARYCRQHGPTRVRRVDVVLEKRDEYWS